VKFNLGLAEKLYLLTEGEVLSASSVKHPLIEELISEQLIERKGRIQKTLSVPNPEALKDYLYNTIGLSDLKEFINVDRKKEVTRSELVLAASNSKHRQVRTFKGFLVNSFAPLKVKLNRTEQTLNFTPGIFQFIYDFEKFEIDENITIVGIENAENFRFIEKQQHLFKNIQPLFVCRYPQNQSKDLINWLHSIPNNYLHFGDFDFAGIGIYMNEYKKYLDEKARFYIPQNIETLIQTFGNLGLYNKQKINFDVSSITEQNLINLIEVIHKYKRGLEQEALIQF
jgi:DNA-binding transcriptional regulator/RsmH inhibitor MraZ